MPQKCYKCKSTNSLIWRKGKKNIFCNECFVKKQAELGIRTTNDDVKTGSVPVSKNQVQNSAEAAVQSTATDAPGAHGRRSMFKKTPVKTAAPILSLITSQSVLHKGSYFKVGDIIAMVDENGDTYYAQIRILLTDQYNHKSAMITWLYPTKGSPPPNKGFDPSTYIIGHEENTPRDLDCMEFVMHTPSEYFKAIYIPETTTSGQKKQ